MVHQKEAQDTDFIMCQSIQKTTPQEVMAQIKASEQI
jgi:hypothetical protein